MLQNGLPKGGKAKMTPYSAPRFDSGRFPATQEGKRRFWGFPWNPETALGAVSRTKPGLRQSYGNPSFLEMRGEAKSPYRLSFLTGSGPEGLNRRR